MTLIARASAEWNTLLELDAYTGGSAISTTQKRSGAYSFRVNQSSTAFANSITRYFTANAEIFLQVGYYFANLPTNGDSKILKLTKGTTVIAGLIMTTAGILKLYTGDFASLVGTSSGAVQANTWQVIEIHLKVADANDGIGRVRLNGTLEIDYSGVGADTKPGADTTVDRLTIGCPNTIGTAYVYVDDIVINDINDTTGGLNPNNSWPGGLSIVLLKPTGASADGAGHTQWTPSTGANWECVNELPPVITDMISATVDGKMDTYVIEDCPAGMGPIAAAVACYWCQKTGAPAINNIKRLMRFGTTDRVGSNIAIPTSFLKVEESLQLSPDTSQPFTTTEINALEFGVQSAT